MGFSVANRSNQQSSRRLRMLVAAVVTTLAVAAAGSAVKDAKATVYGPLGASAWVQSSGCSYGSFLLNVTFQFSTSGFRSFGYQLSGRNLTTGQTLSWPWRTFWSDSNWY